MNHVPQSRIRSSFFTVLLFSLSFFSQQVLAECMPAPNPDLNNDGIVSLADFFIVTNNFGSSDPDDTADTNCDGSVDSVDVLFVQNAMGQVFTTGPSLTIDAPDSLDLTEGETKNISYTVSLDSSELVSVEFSQEIIPQDNGISLTNDAPSAWQSSSDIDWVVNGTISSVAIGNYVVKTTATISGTDVVATTETEVKVISDDPFFEIYIDAPIAFPDGITTNTPTLVEFGVQINSGSGSPDSVVLQQLDAQDIVVSEIGTLVDDGLANDVAADDLIYSLDVDMPAMEEGALRVRAVAMFGAERKVSEPTIIPITPFPTSLTPSNTASLIPSGEFDQQIFSDQIIVGFSENATSESIQQVVSEVGGTIAGTIISENIFQITFGVPNSIDELNLIIDDYLAQTAVDFADFAYEATIDDVYPDDPSKASQANMSVARVDEVWLLSKGGGSIAIVDTGVDYNHPDLSVVKGKDFISNDNDPMDTNGHGTHVAGIAAAKINNGKSVAGVSDSKILAVRGLLGGSDADAAKAIKYAASKARVVNISGGWYKANSEKVFEKVTSKLGAKIIVSTAGNCGKSQMPCIGSERKRFPCFNSNVFCVGNSTDGDDRSPGSNFGDWVDIAAPGENVLSTKLGGGTTKKTGTSMAAPLVAGSAMLLWNQHPGWGADKIKSRLLDTAVEASGLNGKKIGNRIDVFEAFFNGDFEIGLEEWMVSGTCSTKAQLGSLTPQKGDKMLFCSTGPAGDQVQAELKKVLSFEANSDFRIKFSYNFISEEYPEFVGSVFDDSLTIKLVAPNGSETILAQESVNASSFSAIGGIDFPGGDNTTGHTGWKPIDETITVASGGGNYNIVIEDAGDDVYDTAVLIDNIRLK